jgi:predicted nucleic acid-binding protein
MNPVFIDASFWIALRARDEPEHAAACELAHRLAAERQPLVTTDLVFAEIHAYFSRYRRLREQILSDFWDSGLFQFRDTTFADKQQAVRLLRANQDKSYSFCDAVSFVVIERLHLRRVASFDPHFRQFGRFEVLS